MKHTLLGIRPMSFVDDKTGELIEGTKIYASYESGAQDLVGKETVDIFLRTEQVPEDLEAYIGEEINIEYNRKGKLAKLSLSVPA